MLQTAKPPEKTNTELFSEFVEMMHTEHTEDPKMSDWWLYEHLKGCIDDFSIPHDTGVRIITEKLEI
jgi:hypothetical protein